MSDAPKVWEEEWYVDGYGAISRRDSVGDKEAVGRLDGHDRTELGSAAPDMARLLLAIEWCGHVHECASCHEPEYRGHSSTCAWVAALRKAGVRA